MKKAIIISFLFLLLGCESPFSMGIPYTRFGKMLYSSDNITGGNYPDKMDFGVGTDSLHNVAFLNFYIKPTGDWSIKKIRTKFLEGNHQQDTIHHRHSSTMEMNISRDKINLYTTRFSISYQPDTVIDIDIDSPFALDSGYIYTFKFFIDDDGDSTPYTPDSIPYAYFSFDYGIGDTTCCYFMWYMVKPDSQVVDSQRIYIPMEIYQ